jgi:hypothetical protein
MDENASRDMGGVIEAARRLIRKHGVTIILIHHTGKSDKAGPRGWSGLEGAMDGAYLVTANREERAALWTVHKPLKDHDCAHVKLGLKGEIVAIGEEDGEAITSLVFRRDEAAAQRANVEAISTALRADAFLKLVPGPDQHAVTTAVICEAVAAELFPEEDGPQRATAFDRAKTWLSDVARGKGYPEVLACMVPGVSPRQWRRPATPS